MQPVKTEDFHLRLINSAALFYKGESIGKLNTVYRATMDKVN